jgi:23S rRNA (adenine2503-C2)-methyltransferase
VSDGEGLSISKRRITLSTSGVVPMIARAGAEIGTMLAVSLHAVRDDLRDTLVPLNRKYPIRDLLEACRHYPGVSNARRITFEYVMLKGINDQAAVRRAGAALKASRPRSISFRSTLARHRYPNARTGADRNSPRSCSAGYACGAHARGRDILAAYGQPARDRAFCA